MEFVESPILLDSGMETVVLLHGELNDASTWKETIKVLEPKFKVLAPNRPVQGSLESQQAELYTLLSNHEKVHLVGHSGGGVLALSFAGQHPEKILSLTLVDSLARLDVALETKIRSVLAALQAGGSRLAYTVAAPWLFGADFLTHQTARLEQALAKAEATPPEVLQYNIEYVLGFGDQRKWLRAIESPVLVAVGSEDVLTPMRYSHEMVEWVKPGLGVLVTITGAGHNAPIEKPDEFNRIVLGFLERAGSFTKPLWDELEDEDLGGEFQDYDGLLS
jgi:3-oxoadipate enol-lactonase